MTGAVAVTDVLPLLTCDMAGIVLVPVMMAPEVLSEEFHSGIYKRICEFWEIKKCQSHTSLAITSDILEG